MTLHILNLNFHIATKNVVQNTGVGCERSFHIIAEIDGLRQEWTVNRPLYFGIEELVLDLEKLSKLFIWNLKSDKI